jgi:hypothetical protein
MKKPNSTIVDTIVMASKLPLIKAGILLRMSKPKTTSTPATKPVSPRSKTNHQRSSSLRFKIEPIT